MRKFLVRIKENWIVILLLFMAVGGYIVGNYLRDREFRENVARLEVIDCVGEAKAATATLVSNDLDRQVWIAFTKTFTGEREKRVLLAGARAKAQIIDQIEIPNCEAEIKHLKSLGLNVPDEVANIVKKQHKLSRIDLEDGLLVPSPSVPSPSQRPEVPEIDSETSVIESPPLGD